MIAEKINPEKESEEHNPLIKRLPKVSKRSNTSRVENKDTPLKNQVSGFFQPFSSI